MATDPEKKIEEHHGNSGGEHLPAAGLAPEQPDEGQQLTTTKTDDGMLKTTGGDMSTPLEFAALVASTAAGLLDG
jgi:hypothetical protein